MKKIISTFLLLASALVFAQVIPPPNPGGGGGGSQTNSYRFNATQFATVNTTNISIASGALVTNLVMKFPADTSFTNLGVGTLNVTNITGPWTNQFINSNAGLGTNNVLRTPITIDAITRGTEWTSRTSAADHNFVNVVHGNGRFVAIAITGSGGSQIMTSPDGINWTARASASNFWRGLAYGNGLFVAVANSGTGNRVTTSPDGITWTSRTSAADNDWFSVAYGNGLFVAVASSGSGNRVMTSPDGITWTSRTSAADNNWRGVVFGNGLFVATAATGTGNRVMTSLDGITWTSRTSAADNDWYNITYGNGLFVTVAQSGTSNRVMTSPDGVNWSTQTTPTNDWRGITYGSGIFVAVATTGTGNRVMTSPDGTNWTARVSAADNSWGNVCYGNGVFVAVSFTGTGNRVMTSGKTELTITPPNNILQGPWSVSGSLFVGTNANNGNLLVGATAAGTALTSGIAVGSGAPPTTFPADAIQMRSGDVGGVAGRAGMFVYDEIGLAAMIGTNSQYLGSLQIQRAITNLANASANPAKFTSAGMLTNGAVDLTGTEVTGLLKAASIPILTGGEVEAAGGTAVANLTTTGVTPGTYDAVVVDSKGRVTSGSVSPTPSTPASTTGPPTNGLTMRLVADSISGTNNMVVTNWPDTSGYSHHGGSTTGLTLQPGVANGHAAVDFGTIAGTSGFLDVTNFFTGYTAGSIFFVMRTAADPAVQNTRSGLMEFGALAATAPQYPKTSDSVIYEGFGSTTIHTVGNPIQALNTWHTYDVSMDATAYTVTIDGTNFLAGGSHTVGWHTNGYIGKSDDNTMAGTYFLRGQIAEVLMYNRTLTAGDRLALSSYVNATYGIPIAQTPTLSVTAGLAARWEAEGLTNMVHGDSITNWFDQSPFSRTATQGTAANRPTYRTNIFGNKPAARFDGVNDELTFDHNSIGSFTVFVVWNATADAGSTANYGGPLGFSESGKNGFSLVSNSGSSAAYQSHLVVYGPSSEFANFTIPTEGLNLSQAQRGTKVDMWRWNGGFTGSGGATMAISGATQTVTNSIESLYGRSDSIGKGNAFIACDIGCILVYNRPLADLEVAAVTAYLNQKYPASAIAYTAATPQSGGGTGSDTSGAPIGSVFFQGTNGFSYSPSFKYNSVTPSLQLSNSATLSVSGNITNLALTASLPVKTDANKALVSGAIDLSGSEAIGILTENKGGTGANISVVTAGNVFFQGSSAFASDDSFNYDATSKSLGVGISAPTDAGVLGYRSGAKTQSDVSISGINTTTSSTAGQIRAGIYASSPGTWNGATSKSAAVWISGSSGGTENYAIYDNSGAGSTLSGNLTVAGVTSSANVQGTSFRINASGPTWTFGTGSPETVVTAPVGSFYSRSDGGAGTSWYVKESGTGNTGWVGK